jgi:trigger factor
MADFRSRGAVFSCRKIAEGSGQIPSSRTKFRKRKGGFMKTKVEKSNSVRHKMHVEITAERVEEIAQKVLKEIQKETAIKGFRKGEVPLDILRKYLGEDADKEIIKRVVKDTYIEAVKQEGAAPISEPFIEHEKYEQGKPFIYYASYDVMPEVPVPEYEGLKLEKEKVEVSGKEVEEELKRLQYAMTQLEPAEDGVIGPGFVGLIDFKGTVDGKPFKGSEATNFVADYGNMLPEFEKEIEGMKKGEERDISFDYPAGYFNKEIAGKKGSFHVVIKDIRKKIVPELNDDFAKTLGKFQTMGELKAEIEKQILAVKEDLWRRRLGEKAIRELAEKNVFDVPETMISNEIGAMLEEVARQLKLRGQTIEEAGLDVKTFIKANYEEAKKRIRGYLLAFAISKREAIVVTEEDINSRLTAISRQTNQALDKVRAHFQKENLMDKLRTQILYEKTLDFVVSKANVKEISPKKQKKGEKK